MRIFGLVLAATVFITVARGEEPKTDDPAAALSKMRDALRQNTPAVTKKPNLSSISEEEVIGSLGSRLVKVFAKFGEPEDIFVINPKSDEPSVCLDYGGFDFLLKDRTVRGCRFWPSWKPGAVCGVKFGSTIDEVNKKLGPGEELGDAQHLAWDYKANGEIVLFQAIFDKDNKCSQIYIRLR